jgi:hypothetical protein
VTTGDTNDTGPRVAFEGELKMFRVDNADFIAEKLAAELLPLQEFREVAKNAEEAILRRMQAEGTFSGRIEFDVDWYMHSATVGNPWYISCADNGDGMTRTELERYTTTLAVRGANQNQTISGNQGMGLKISGPTRHKEGVLIRTLKDGEASAVQIGWNKSIKEYGLIPLGPNGEVVIRVSEDMFPDFVIKQGSGTVVTFLGNESLDNTFKPADLIKGWLFKYLHTRFFDLTHNGIETYVRVPSGDIEDWPRSRAEAEKLKTWNLSKVQGTAPVWNSVKGASRGVVELPGDPAGQVPAAKVHWWAFPAEGAGWDVSSRTNSGGSISVLFQNELHDWRLGNQSSPYFARMGVLFGKNRVGFVIEPQGFTVASDFARAHVLVGARPIFESAAWLTWAEQFRAALPSEIKSVMDEEQDRLQADDPDRSKRINERLKDVMALLRPRRFKVAKDGNVPAGGAEVAGAEAGAGAITDRPSGPRTPSTPSGGGRGIGAVLSQIDEADGDAAREIFSNLKLIPKWVDEREAESMPLVNGNGKGLHDRAAALVGPDGVSANILALNKQFRGYQTILAAVNEWANPEGDEDKSALITQYTQEWVEQKMVEAVNGLRQLENGSSWTGTNFDDALSPVALTVAFMADRYHTLREVKRQIGSARAAASA